MAIQLDMAVMSFDDLIDDGQAQAATSLFAGTEHLKDVLLAGLWDAGAIVRNYDFDEAIAAISASTRRCSVEREPCRYGDALVGGIALLCQCFACISDEVLKDFVEMVGVSVDIW